MAERGVDEVRQALALERTQLDEARTALRAELRSFVPVIVVGLVALGLVTAGMGLRRGISLIQKLS